LRQSRRCQAFVYGRSTKGEEVDVGQSAITVCPSDAVVHYSGQRGGLEGKSTCDEGEGGLGTVEGSASALSLVRVGVRNFSEL